MWKPGTLYSSWHDRQKPIQLITLHTYPQNNHVNVDITFRPGTDALSRARGLDARIQAISGLDAVSQEQWLHSEDAGETVKRRLRYAIPRNRSDEIPVILGWLADAIFTDGAITQHEKNEMISRITGFCNANPIKTRRHR